jgi:hypothetical protein
LNIIPHENPEKMISTDLRSFHHLFPMFQQLQVKSPAPCQAKLPTWPSTTQPGAVFTGQ